jgi:two-component system, sensor histidine kinase and response regulator
MKPDECTLLLVDDNLDNQHFISLRLTRQGYKILTADNGYQALALLDIQKIDLVLLDIMMPGIDGFEVLRHIRQKRSLADLPVIMATALESSKDVVKALQLGANDYVTKPIDFPILLARIETHLRLRELALLREEFLRVASHDLKNPLFSILVATQLVEELVPVGQPMTDQARALLSMVARQTSEMQRIIEDFLDFQAAEEGKMVLRREAVSLNRLTHAVVELNRDYAAIKSQNLALELEEPMPEIEADQGRITQVIQNLLGNAIKFSPPGGGRILVRTRAGEQAVMFEVSDQGPGLTEEDLARVFSKYGRLSNQPTGGEKSSGLGLAIARKTVELHGGEIGVRNNSGKGATFWFSLPI